MAKLKSKMTISRLFTKYVLMLGLGTIVGLIGTAWFFLLLMNKGVILPADYNEKFLESQRNIIEKGADLKKLIPKDLPYAIYTKQGIFKEGNLENKEQVWQDVQNKAYNKQGYFYKVFYKEDEVSVVLYKFKADFVSSWLKAVLPNAENTFFLLFLIVFIAIFMSVSKRFSRIITREMKVLDEVTQKIKMDNLEFEVEASSIKEINEILDSLIKLKESLKDSLYKQWHMESVRKEQVAALGHDLKTPLTILKGNAELLMETSLSEEQIFYGDHILKKVEELQEYTQLLVEINYSETGLTAKFEKVEIEAWLEALKKDLINEKQIQFEQKNGATPKYMEVDSKLLKRALMNCMMNAIDYAPKGSPILLSVKETSNKLIFAVEDGGAGFSKEELHKVTEKFYRGDKSRNSKAHYGMGLYIAKNIAQIHGGELIVGHSQRLGGAKVSISVKIE